MPVIVPSPEARGVVLVVEDDRDVRESMAEILEGEGYSVRCAANGSEALAFLRSSGRLPGLILLDLMMPVMNGWEFRERQRSDVAFAGIPVVVLSGDPNAAQEANRLRAAASASKPVPLVQLLELVGRYCGSAAGGVPRAEPGTASPGA